MSHYLTYSLRSWVPPERPNPKNLIRTLSDANEVKMQQQQQNPRMHLLLPMSLCFQKLNSEQIGSQKDQILTKNLKDTPIDAHDIISSNHKLE